MNLLKQEQYKTAYALEVSNRFETLNVEENIQEYTEEVVEGKWQEFQTILNESVEKVLPTRGKTAKQKWMTQEILDLMELRRNAKGTTTYKAIDSEIRHKCKEAKEKWWITKCQTIEEMEREYRTKEMHVQIKEMTFNDW